LRKLASRCGRAEAAGTTALYPRRGSERAFAVERTGDDSFLSGNRYRASHQDDQFRPADSTERYQRVLDRSGITAELERQGVEPGDTVTIAGMDMAWGEEFEQPDYAPRRTAHERRYGSETEEEELDDQEIVDEEYDEDDDDEIGRYEVYDLDDEDFDSDEDDDFADDDEDE